MALDAVGLGAVAALGVAAVDKVSKDRVGIGWRGELAAGVFANLDRIDILEIIADDHFHASPKALRALRTLSTQIPITLHGVAMGLASTTPVEIGRLEKMARLVNALEPESWSEHMAFVRAGGIEIGHLAAPPRTRQSVDATVANIELARRIVDATPLMENIATLVEPPASSQDEATWISEIVTGADCNLLLDLHNLYANAVNFGEDPESLLLRLPLHKVSAVHISGGCWIPEPVGHSPRMRLLDDHLHDPPPAVYSLLTVLAMRATRPLSVILERDGDYPDFESLLIQLGAAREALRRGRNMAAQAA